MKLKLSYPVKPLHFNQHFGDNPQMYSDPKYGGVIGHNGADFMAYHGQPVYASHDGIAYYEFDNGQGEGVVIKSNDKFDYNGEEVYMKSIYWHLADASLEPKLASPIYKAVGYKPDQTGVSQAGIPVKRGDLIGYADNTGASTGDHLHFGLKPMAINESNGVWFNVEQKNGYNGAINPEPYFDGTFAQDTVVLNQTEAIIQNIMSADATPQQKIGLLKLISDFLKRFF